MGRGNKLLDALGGLEWVREIGAALDNRHVAGAVLLVLPVSRSRCGATNAAVFRLEEHEGGGYMVRWYRVAGSAEADVVGEFESHRLARVADAVAEDVRVGGRAADPVGAEQPVAA